MDKEAADGGLDHQVGEGAQVFEYLPDGLNEGTEKPSMTPVVWLEQLHRCPSC